MALAARSNLPASDSHESRNNLICCFVKLIKILFILVDAIRNPDAFLRISISSFQINQNQNIHLSEIKTQIELKEKNRSERENVESKIKRQNKYLM